MNILDQLGTPIFQAPIGSASSDELAIAVAEAGGMGSLAMTWTAAEDAAEQIRRIKQATQGVFAANFVLSFEPSCLDAVLEAGVPAVTFSWGFSKALISKVKASGTQVGVQVGSMSGACKALKAGADFLICQGVEAGGHVQSTTPLNDILLGVLRLAGKVPVFAAGGIGNAQDVHETMLLGADGVMLGTRFVNALESRAHPDYQRAIVSADEASLAYTVCFDGGWTYSCQRVIRNWTLERWEAEGCPMPGKRPGEGDIVAVNNGFEIPRYHIASPVNTTEGDVLDLALYAGTSAARIDNVLAAADIISDLCSGIPQTAERQVQVSRH